MADRKIPPENVGKINETAASLDPNQSEIELAQLTPIDSLKIAVPGIKEAKVRMECRLEHALELGGLSSDLDLDTSSPSTDFIIGKIVQFHIEETIYEKGRIDPNGLAAVSRLAGNDYAKVGEIFTVERPK